MKGINTNVKPATTYKRIDYIQDPFIQLNHPTSLWLGRYSLSTSVYFLLDYNFSCRHSRYSVQG